MGSEGIIEKTVFPDQAIPGAELLLQLEGYFSGISPFDEGTEQYVPPLAKAALLLSAIFTLLAIGVQICAEISGRRQGRKGLAQEMLSRFRESHERGELSDEEYQLIKTKLALEVQAELNDTNEQG